MENEELKILHAELKGNLTSRFEIIKKSLKAYEGIQNDEEVLHYLIQRYWTEHLEEIDETGNDWICPICGYSEGLDNLPKKWPVCGVPKDKFFCI